MFTSDQQHGVRFKHDIKNFHDTCLQKDWEKRAKRLTRDERDIMIVYWDIEK